MLADGQRIAGRQLLNELRQHTQSGRLVVTTQRQLLTKSDPSEQYDLVCSFCSVNRPRSVGFCRLLPRSLIYTSLRVLLLKASIMFAKPRVR